MFTVVSEKTGYPYETLELEMDMETDLGIDSIKRVDILGTMQTRFELPQLAPEELAELRTLGQVVEYLEQALGGSSAAATPTPAPVAAPAAAPAPAVPAVPYAPASLTNLPNPDVLAFNVPQGWTCVITDDGTDMTASVAQALAGRGWRPVVLRLPATLIATRPNLPPNVAQVALSDLSEEQLAQVLRGIAEGYGPIGGFVHLHPQAAALIQNGSMFSDLEQQIVRTVFLAAKQLKPALTGAGQQSRSLFVAVTRLDGELGTSMQQDINPVGGGLFGLVKSLRQEWPNVFCRGLDLHPHYNAEQAAQALLVEIGDPDIGLTEVGYGQRGRVTLAANLVAHGGA
jgi:acyl carrier protein